MKEHLTKGELLAKAPVPKALLAMGLPTMVGMMINALYHLADAWFVGGLGTSQLAAITVTFPLGQAVAGLGLLFGSGAASYISRLLGQGKREAAGQTASTALYGSLLAGAAVILCALLFLNPILTALGATKSLLPYAAPYAGVYIGFSIFNIFNVTMNSIVTSEGAAKTTMFALLSGALLNIVLDPLFIYTLDMGVTGAAVATALAQTASSAVYLFYLLKKKSLFRFRPGECRFSWGIVSQILNTGIPTMAFQLLTSLSVTLITNQARHYGEAVIAGMGVVTRIMTMGSLMVFGFVKGFQPIAGYSYGAGNYGRLRESVKTAVIWTTLFCTAFGLGLALFPEQVIACFTKGDDLLLSAGREALRANGLSFLWFGFYTVYSSLFLALGKGAKGFLLGACRQGICFLPAVFLLPAFCGLRGVFYAQPAADAVSAVITIGMAVLLHRELAKTKQEPALKQPAGG